MAGANERGNGLCGWRARRNPIPVSLGDYQGHHADNSQQRETTNTSVEDIRESPERVRGSDQRWIAKGGENHTDASRQDEKAHALQTGEGQPSDPHGLRPVTSYPAILVSYRSAVLSNPVR